MSARNKQQKAILNDFIQFFNNSVDHGERRPTLKPGDFMAQLRNSEYSPQPRPTSLRIVTAKSLINPTYYPSETRSCLSQSPTKICKKLEDGHSHQFQFRTQILVVGCQRHSEEISKFIDVNSLTFEPLCDLCLVDPEVSLGRMKMERIVDLQERMRHLLMNQIDELKELEVKVDLLTKDINVINAQRNPWLALIDEMERQVNKETEYAFRRLRERFLVLNPLGDIKNSIKKRTDKINNTLHNLDSQGDSGLNTLRDLLKDEFKMKESLNHFKNDIYKRLDDASSFNPGMDKDWKLVQNSYDEFIEILRKLCERLACASIR
jgi:hypothetical protein